MLVVDDEPDICWALENILNSAGYQARTAVSGKEALELVKENPFEVAFIDAKLPDMDGTQLAREIKEIDPKLALVLISGYFHEGKAIEEGFAQGLYVGFIGKPFDLEEVRSAAKRALEVARGSP